VHQNLATDPLCRLATFQEDISTLLAEISRFKGGFAVRIASENVHFSTHSTSSRFSAASSDPDRTAWLIHVIHIACRQCNILC
jgi:hypothetical protein